VAGSTGGRGCPECIAAPRGLSRGDWLPWLKRELGWTEQIALNFIRLAQSKSKSSLDLNLPVSGLYLLEDNPLAQ
jgi:hypothetical protein